MTYEPDDAFAHSLDPRGKLGFQFGFATAAFVHPVPYWLAVLTVVALVALTLARASVREAVREFRFVMALLVVAPVLEGLTLGAPWFSVEDAIPTALASYRVLLILLVSAAYVRSTPVRESRAAIQRIVPGRVGQFLGVGVSLVFRFLPVLQRDLGRIRDAVAARLGDQRPVREQMQVVGARGIDRAFTRADRLALALRARCFAWNPTLPALRMRGRDWALAGASIALVLTAILL